MAIITLRMIKPVGSPASLNIYQDSHYRNSGYNEQVQIITCENLGLITIQILHLHPPLHNHRLGIHHFHIQNTDHHHLYS